MEIIQSENCGTCQSNVPRRHDESICEVFNLPIEMYAHTTSKYGCNNYVKDANKVAILPTKAKIKGKDYVLWDTQYSDSNAEFSAEMIGERIPKSVPEIIMLQQKDQEPVFGVYVRKVMSDDAE